MTDRLSPPTPEQIKDHRSKLGLTQAQAAKIVGVNLRAYQFFESDPANKKVHRTMHPAYWELFQLKTSEEWRDFQIPDDVKVPTPKVIRDYRTKHGLTQTQAANLVHTGIRTWQQWEAPEIDEKNSRAMHPSFWELFIYKVTHLSK